MKMCLITAVAAFGIAAAGASAQVNLPLNITNVSTASNDKSATSAAAAAVAPGYAWSIDLAATTITCNVPFAGLLPLQLSSYGTPGADLTAAGVAAGPGTLFTRQYTYTDPIQPLTPVYDFTVSLVLQADRTLKTTVHVNSLSQFPAFGTFTPFPMTTPVMGVNVASMATVTALPAPGALALAGAGGVLTMRRRRK